MRVELDNVGKTYDGDSWAVRDLKLEIPSGAIFGLIGPNGAGKSTTLRIMATVMIPTEGQVRHDGEDSSRDPLEARRRIGFLGDGNPLYKDMTPTEYLRMFGQCFRMGKAELERAIDETLTTFDLDAKRDTPCGALSKGMRQRVLIARCLLHKPGLLILDEPADGLDPRGRNDLRRTLDRIRETGVTIVISSHILRELDDLCDQVAIIQRGRLVVAGDVERIIDSHEVSRFVYELRMLSDGPEGQAAGLDRALEVLAGQRALVEHTGEIEGQHLIRLQVQGGEALMASILAELIRGGVSVVTCSRVRSRLEDVYDRISEDQVN
ncbi:Daunorubicin/doxorubicin resistance ATP-binding protein DrrA [Enhygromyxa salina]|uniref:Daunorubicin/doxorubicin resistance ATP-binding protein DrrA n=1 Tax=Enhygromyxa salina TaxID=215803 RepID=A0A2S9YHT7_9BACT|nr:ABC transporter ATP-binding protein [Enhygromyxa salina]PRQ04673.1 Daunorubicin/doxorubicin resistance ATP-binding protein DrrA [Enhygromyxa salina]